MVLLSKLIEELRDNIDHNKDLLKMILKKNPNMLYQKINEISLITGSRYNVNLQLHFPDSKKISDIESYGEENIKLKAIEIMGNNIQAQDAYMYEGKEGVKIIFEKGRIEVLPGSCHFWCKIDERVKSYGDWLMKNVYLH